MGDKEQLYFDSLSEIAAAVGDSFQNPLSVSLLCLTLGISNEEKGRIFVAFNQVLRQKERGVFEELSVQLFRESLENSVPRAKEFDDIVVTALIKGFTRNLIVELIPFANTL